jgi:hypothetical protein
MHTKLLPPQMGGDCLEDLDINERRILNALKKQDMRL